MSDNFDSIDNQRNQAASKEPSVDGLSHQNSQTFITFDARNSDSLQIVDESKKEQIQNERKKQRGRLPFQFKVTNNVMKQKQKVMQLRRNQEKLIQKRLKKHHNKS